MSETYIRTVKSTQNSRQGDQFYLAEPTPSITAENDNSLWLLEEPTIPANESPCGDVTHGFEYEVDLPTL